MARKHRRRYGSVVSVGLGRLPILNSSVSFKDAAIGVGLGLVGSALLKGLVKKFAPSAYASAAGAVGQFMPAVAGIGAGAILYYAQKKTHSATGQAAGAVLAGLALSLWDFAKNNLATMGGGMLDFSGTVGVNLGRYGMVINDKSDNDQGIQGYNGLLIADHSDSLAELANISMGADNDGIAELMAM